MKVVLIIMSLIMSLQVFGSKRGDAMECKSDELNLTIKLIPTSDFLPNINEVKEMCLKHSKIQFDWENFSFYKLELGKRTFSGVACTEDVNFEFKSAQKVLGESVSVRIWLDELFDSNIIVGGEKFEMDCEYID